MIEVGRGAKNKKQLSGFGFQPLNHNKQKCKMFPNNNHAVVTLLFLAGKCASDSMYVSNQENPSGTPLVLGNAWHPLGIPAYGNTSNPMNLYQSRFLLTRLQTSWDTSTLICSFSDKIAILFLAKLFVQGKLGCLPKSSPNQSKEGLGSQKTSNSWALGRQRMVVGDSCARAKGS